MSGLVDASGKPATEEKKEETPKASIAVVIAGGKEYVGEYVEQEVEGGIQTMLLSAMRYTIAMTAQGPAKLPFILVDPSDNQPLLLNSFEAIYFAGPNLIKEYEAAMEQYRMAKTGIVKANVMPPNMPGGPLGR